MILEGCGQSTVVNLVDQRDNGNREGFGGDAEALYCFGKDGLRILHGSVLHIGGLNVYAMLEGVITNLHDLFLPGQTFIAFDEGYILRGAATPDHPANLISFCCGKDIG